MSDGTYVELNGKFRFAINQNGLDYQKEGDRKIAIKDFWYEWELFCEKIRDMSFITYDYDEKDLIVKEGE